MSMCWGHKHLGHDGQVGQQVGKQVDRYVDRQTDMKE